MADDRKNQVPKPGYSDQNPELLLPIAARLAIGYVIVALASIATTYLTALAGARFLNDRRGHMFSRMQSYSVHSYESTGNQAVVGLLIMIPVLFYVQWKRPQC